MKNLIKKSKFWNEQYNNFQALTQEAKDFLKVGWLITTSLVDSGLQAVVWFSKQDPDYGKFYNDWEAKNAQPIYTPITESIIPIEEYNKLPQVVEIRKEKEAKIEKEKTALKFENLSILQVVEYKNQKVTIMEINNPIINIKFNNWDIYKINGRIAKLYNI